MKPLIEKEGKTLRDNKREIKEMDPNGTMHELAKQKKAQGEVTPEESRLASALSDVSFLWN